MTSSGPRKQGPPAHQNRFAYHHNPSSRLTSRILSSPINHLCPACTEIIKWRKQYRKYKPLTVAKRCCRCQEKSVKDAYHVVCDSCAGNGNVCAKCLDSRELDEKKKSNRANETIQQQESIADSEPDE